MPDTPQPVLEKFSDTTRSSKRTAVAGQLADYLAASTPTERLKVIEEKYAGAIDALAWQFAIVRQQLDALPKARGGK
jgi:hypothetical protein